uniref:TNFR-Cys domain-containing protein n=1 Tax=Neogobius melanostomus TaxID=47308 RepID=A0A8C6T1A4_9GOBI
MIQLSNMQSSEGGTILLIIILTHAVISRACHRAEYQIGNECCPMCPAGTRVNKHCTEFRSTSCLPCDEGTYMDNPTGMTQCFSCRICAPGSGMKVKTVCSSNSNALCEPQEGYFCVEPPKERNCEVAQKHSDCNPGQYIQQPGSPSADTVCSPCAEGTFSNGTLSRCQPHTQCEQMDKATVKAGTLHSDAECGETKSSSVVIVAVIITIVLLAVIITVVAVIFKKIQKKNVRPNSEENQTELMQDHTKPVDHGGA